MINTITEKTRNKTLDPSGILNWTVIGSLSTPHSKLITLVLLNGSRSLRVMVSVSAECFCGTWEGLPKRPLMAAGISFERFCGVICRDVDDVVPTSNSSFWMVDLNDTASLSTDDLAAAVVRKPDFGWYGKSYEEVMIPRLLAASPVDAKWMVPSVIRRFAEEGVRWTFCCQSCSAAAHNEAQPLPSRLDDSNLVLCSQQRWSIVCYSRVHRIALAL